MSESVLLVWVSTYLVHSTVLLGLTWLLARGDRAGGVARREWLWRAAMLGGLTSATAQTLVDVRPVTGSLPWPRTLEAESAPRFEPTPSARSAAPRTPRVAAAPTVAVATSPIAPEPTNDAPAVSLTPAWFVLAAGLWLLVLAWRAERALGRRRPLTSGPWSDALRTLEAEAGLRRRVRLTVSDRLRVPVALGVLRPEICVPRRAVEELPPELVRAALAHELAHHARRDPFWLGLAHLVRSALLVQPLNRVAAKELARLAELSADAWAVRRTGDRLALARCLTEVAGWLQRSEPPIAACAMVRRGGALEERVRALLDGSAAPEGRAGARRSALCGALLAAPLLLPGWSTPAEPTEPGTPPVAGGSVTERLGRALDGELARIEARLAALVARPLTREHAALRAALDGRSRELREQLAEALGAARDHERRQENSQHEEERQP